MVASLPVWLTNEFLDLWGVNSEASCWLRELDYCLVKQRDNGVIAFEIYSLLIFFCFSFSFKGYGGGMGYLCCFLIKLPSSGGCVKLKPRWAQMFDVLAESLPMILKSVVRLKQLLPCSLTWWKGFTYLVMHPTIWLTVMRIASIYPIVTNYSPENFGKTHIQYSDT